MRLKDKLKLLFRLPLTWLEKQLYKTPIVINDLQTIEIIKNNNCSVARFGDGELNLMCNIGIKFQKADKLLSKRLREIANKNDYSKILICIPDIFLSRKQLKKKFIKEDSIWYYKNLLITRGLWHRNFRNSFYGDANLSRFYVERNDKERTAQYVKCLKELWQNSNIVFVEGDKSRLGMGNDLFENAKSIKRILCPSKNAFDKSDEILYTVLSLTKSDDLIICALGPTATILSYDLSNNNRRVLDLGHVDIEYEWYLMGAKSHVGIEGKAMEEGGDKFCEVEEKKPTNVVATIL